MFKTRKAPPPPLQLDSSPSSSSRDSPSTGSYKHYNPLPPTPSSALALGHCSPSSPTTFKFWKRKTSASSPTDASFPPTPPHTHSSFNNTTTARTHPSSSYASTSSTPLRTSTSNNLPQSRDRQGGSYPSPSPSASNHSSFYNQQQQAQAYTSPTPQQDTPLPQLPASSSSRSALYFDEDYDWTNGHQSDFGPPSFASPFSTSSLPPPRTRASAQPSSPVGNWQSSPPPRNTDVPFSARLPPQRRESDSPKVYISTRRTGASSSVGGPASGGFGSHSGWGGAGSVALPPRRESYGVPVGAARMGHGRKRSRSMSNLPAFIRPVTASQPAADDSAVSIRSSSRRGPPPSSRLQFSTSSRPPPSRTNSPISSSPSPTTLMYPSNHHVFGMGPPPVRPPLQLSGLPVVVVVPATPDTASLAGEGGSRKSGGWGEVAMPPIPPSESVAVDLAKRMEEEQRPPVVLVSTRPQSPARALPFHGDAQAATFIAQAAAARESSVTPTPSNPGPSSLSSSLREAAIRLPDIEFGELGLSWFSDEAIAEPAPCDTPTLPSSWRSESSSSPIVVEDRSSTPPARIVPGRARSVSKPLTSPPRVPLPARPVEEEEEEEEEEQSHELENEVSHAFRSEESHGSMPSLSSSFSVDSTISSSSSEADWSDNEDASSEGGEHAGGLDKALSEMINSLSTSDAISSNSHFAARRRESKAYSPPLYSDNFLLQQPVSSSASNSLTTPRANGNRPLPTSNSTSSFVSTSSSILNSPSTAPWHDFPLPPHTSASAPALSGLGLGLESADLLPPRKRQILAPMLVRDHRRPFYLSSSTGCLADKVGNWGEETPPNTPSTSTFSVIISPPPAITTSSPNHRSTVSTSDIDLISFEAPMVPSSSMGFKGLPSTTSSSFLALSASSSSSSLASDASGESSIFSAEDDLGTVSISHVQTTENVRWAFARSGSALNQSGEGEAVFAAAGWAM